MQQEILSFLEITKALQNEGVPISKLLSLASDWPNGNKTVFRLVYEKLSEICGRSLVDMDTCTLHIVHNALVQVSRLMEVKPKSLYWTYMHF